ncbi:molybdopterin-dependent oxidoreductase [Kineosporia succinea]|uniref:DMSO/TMAO reductase YedYZ molybdopterin-dependent catalytic subunit n=1 Tax=Kineosporia succinea TaxID=84632 RepID=A0ABT9NZ72_9ACTN|nr:molybdopterin-dependent oxidoreductase [Kineosporia succinea]MDP9825270.1 DMSO/TMAO reductase YedYZ molybdopterin-dependent catalytic subunit [Kineosporia succinea]
MKNNQLLIAAGAGLASGVLALGLAEVVAGLVSPSAAPIIALGDVVVDNVPAWLKTFAVSTFGTHDKVALLTVAYLIAAALSALAGVLALKGRLGTWLVLALGALAALAAATRPEASALSALPSLIGAAAGMFVLDRLIRTNRSRPPDDRRAVLGLGVVLGVGIATGGIGNWLGARLRGATASREAIKLPVPADPAPALPSGVEVGVDGMEPFLTPNADFYRIDTALSVPLLKAEDWELRIHGLVDSEVTLTWAQLVAGDLIERDLTLMCVSNEVGGDLTGNARWIGLPVAPLLERAGVRPAADMVLSTSSDGWTASTPLETLTDGRDAILAIGMNGEPLPLEHGFPVRMIVPGLYGYVSATKWVVDLEVTRFDAVEAYWTPRGWSERGPVKTGSRIDVPSNGTTVDAGKVAVAGIAWAQHRGITAVEVRVNEGAWQPATLAAEDSVDTWRQWYFAWEASSGEHRLQVRATDGDGMTQTGDEAPPAPDGATGWHEINVSVR